ncbi:MAG TPA: DMT family transporter [Candidatus Limnocylindrales bacterium]|nr:DMT family transporter [Candidatus Limnocylindrales bacterium]
MFTRPDRRPSRAIAVPTGVGWGIVLAIGAALISGLAIYLNAFAVKQLPDAAVYTTLKNAVAAVVLLTVVLGLGAGRGLRTIPRRRWPAVLAVGVIGGSVPFVLFFTGLAQASAPSAAFIQKTLFLWVALLALPFLGERLGGASVVGLAVLLVGQALVLPPERIQWGTGETMILAATLFWAAETVLVKRLLGTIPGPTMAALRMGIGLMFLVGYLAVTGKLGVLAGLAPIQWGWALLTGLILAGYVGTWFAALQRAPASVVTSVLVLGAVVTGALTAVSKGAAPNPTVIVGYLLIVAAAALIAASSVRAAGRLTASGSGRAALGATAD